MGAARPAPQTRRLLECDDVDQELGRMARRPNRLGIGRAVRREHAACQGSARRWHQPVAAGGTALSGVDRKSVVEGKRESECVDLGGRRIIEKIYDVARVV